MITNPKSLVDMGCNTAIMASFAVPVYGAGIAAGIAAGQMVFDIFFQLPDRSDPRTMTPNRNDLQNAINELKVFITDANFDASLANYRATILTMNDQLSKVWVKSASGSKKVAARVARGPLYQGDVSDAQVASWKAEIAGFAQPVLNNPSALLDVIAWIEGDQNHKYQTLGLYTLAASLWNMYCRLNIALEYNMALYDYKAVKSKYDEAMTNYHTAHFAWKHTPEGQQGPEPREPVEPEKPQDDEAFLNGSIFAGKIDDEIDRFIGYLETHVNVMDKNFTNRQNAVDTRLKAITLKGSGSAWYYHDSILKKDSRKVKWQQLAAGQMAAQKGAIRLAMWNRLTDQYGLKGLKKDDVDTLKDTLKEWKKTKKSIAPK